MKVFDADKEIAKRGGLEKMATEAQKYNAIIKRLPLAKYDGEKVIALPEPEG